MTVHRVGEEEHAVWERFWYSLMLPRTSHKRKKKHETKIQLTGADVREKKINRDSARLKISQVREKMQPLSPPC